MASFLLRGTLTFVACLFFSTANGQQGCIHDCFDYNRICPAVKDRSHYDQYVAEHKAGSLSHFSNAPIPPEPDCNTGFYKFGCPRSCGRCIPCETVDAAFVQNLIQQLEQKQTATDTSFQTILQELTQKVAQPDPSVHQAIQELEQKMNAVMDSRESSMAELDQKCSSAIESIQGAVGELHQQLNSDDSSVHKALKQMEEQMKAADSTMQTALGDLHKMMIEADAALKADLSARMDALEAEVAKQPVSCNPCTEVMEHLGNGQIACKPKYDSVYVPKGECSCACGDGTQVMEKKCVAYKERNGKCVQVDNFVQNCPDGEPTKEESCSNGPCTVTNIVEKTSTDKWSESNDAMRYVAVTDNGIKCQLGVVKQPDNKQRSKGDIDTYDQTDIETPVCSKICMKKSEVFAYLEITVSGSDGWKSDYVEVTVNGNSQKYTQPKFLDEKDTLEYKKA